MEQRRNVNLPVIGRVQHGEQITTSDGKKRVKEYGSFIAKIKDSHMQGYLQKFDSLCKGKTNIEIQIFDDNPLTKKYERFNQGGSACSCMEGSNKAKQKVTNGWQEINCDKVSCQYRKRDNYGKMACNRIGWFKFLIPSISTNRIWLMRITGQTSIDRLDEFFSLKKSLGQSIKGNYILFLKQEEQSNSFAKSFNNYILDIIDKEDFISKTNNQTTNQEKLSTNNSQTVDNTVVNTTPKQTKSTISTLPKTNVIEEKAEKPVEQEEPKAEVKKETTKKTTKKTATSKKTSSTSKKMDNEESKIVEVQPTENKNTSSNSLDNCYMFVSTHYENIKNKLGESKEYLIALFHNMSDEPFNIVINPKDAPELLTCDLGTFVKLDLKTVGEKIFALNIEYIEKKVKNIAA